MGSEYFETNSLDFTEFWANTGVNSEVLRGAKLREEKPNCSKNQQQFTPVNININGSVKKMKHGKRKRGTNTKKYSRCPMRIAELAVPTKRQCLDTWRNRGKTLPNFMVERLRQHVMDERAVVHINDAIYCFKAHKVKRSRPNKFKSIKKGNIDRTKLFCAIFGHRIVLKLLPPGRIPVHTSLRNLTEIVNNDIEQLLGKRKRNTIHKTIRDEISEKVTVWIASVLDDSDIKLMMDDLEDLEEKEGHVWDIIDDLIDAIVVVSLCIEVKVPMFISCIKSCYFQENCKTESISYVDEKYPSETCSFNSIDSNISRSSLNKEEKISFYDDININNIDTETNEYKTNMIDVILLDIIDTICGYDNQINGFVQNLLDNTVSEVIGFNNEEININNEINTIDMTGSHSPKMIILEQADSVNEFISNNTDKIVFNVTETPESNTSKLENREETKNTDEQNDFDNQTYYDVLPKDTSTQGADNDIIKERNNSENQESVTIREQIQLESPESNQTEQIQEDDAWNQLTVSETKLPIEYGSDTNVSMENIELEPKDSYEWPEDSFKKETNNSQ
ncbi:uncharacterized protein LOC125050229 isoform X2 [Pieris napi]|uniref:uncharacterized protein LOC125050229 isoform X2 n=1 Tax=Pieris napi TaxID=78633 RepID=UPI001FB916F8|nr:uncharacterized protein LOC125050229 isoform X2 [Pieris napi]